jgi:hypothetical protein
LVIMPSIIISSNWDYKDIYYNGVKVIDSKFN